MRVDNTSGSPLMYLLCYSLLSVRDNPYCVLEGDAVFNEQH